MYAKGKFTIHVKDAETLEELRVIEANNSMTWYGEYQMHRGSNMLTINYDDICISNEKLLPGVDVSFYIDHIYATGTNLQSPKYVAKTESTPAYIELYQRFQPSGTRTINTIYVSSSGNIAMWAYAGLSEPCIQASTEVLDVYYRVQYFEGTVSNDTPNYSVSDNWPALHYRQGISGGQQNGTPYYSCIHSYKAPKHNQYLTLARMNRTNTYNYNIYNISSRGYDDTNWMVTNTWSRGTTSELGQMMSLIAWGYSPQSNNGYRSAIHTPMTTDTFTYKPIQPIHRHRWDAPTPFLDVDYLSSSTAIYSANGDAWTKMEKGFPEFHRIDFTSTGALGAAHYTTSSRKCLGFRNIEWRQHHGVFPFLNSRYLPIAGMHGWMDLNNFVEYVNDSFIVSDTTGITVIRATNGDVEILDADSTPALPVLNVQQVASEQGIIWVACAMSGLYKIENALDDLTPTTVTLMTNATNGVIDGDCFAVDIAINQEVFAMFDGGLGHSTDLGATWTIYNTGTTPAFNWTGITDFNYDMVRSIHIDREDVNHQMAIMYVDPLNVATGRASTVWWNTTGAVNAGPSTTNLLDDDLGRSRTQRLRCSRWGSFWIMNNDLCYRMDPNTTTLTRLGDNDNFARANNAVFFYDHWGKPYVNACWSYDSNQNRWGLYDKYGRLMSHHDVDYLIDGDSAHRASADAERIGIIFTWEYDKDSSLYMFYRGHNSTQYVYSDAFRIFQMSPKAYAHSNGLTYGIGIDSWNGLGTPFEDFVWDKWGWNGSSWESGYNLPMDDTTANNNNAVRANFHPGLSEFYGNAYAAGPIISTLSEFTIGATVRSQPVRDYVSGDQGTLWAIGNQAGVNVYMTKFTNEKLSHHITTTDLSNNRVRDSYLVTGTADNDPEYRLIVTAKEEINPSIYATGAAAEWQIYYYPERYKIQYHLDTDTLQMNHYSHSSGEYYGINAIWPNLDSIATEDFKITFNRNSVAPWKQNSGTSRLIYTNHGCLVTYLVDDSIEGEIAYNTGIYYNHRPTGLTVGNYFAIVWPAVINIAPEIYTRLDHYNDTDVSNTFTNMTVVEHFTAADLDGTNTTEVRYEHDGTKYNISIYCNGVLKYTGSATIPRPVNARIIMNYSAGDSDNCEEQFTGFNITNMAGGKLTYNGTAKTFRTYIDGSIIDQFVAPELAAIDYDSYDIGAIGPRFSTDDYPKDFYRGTASNIQLWNVALNASSITDDFAVTPVATTTQSAVNLITRYTNVDLDYTAETKVTHASEDPMFDGITNSFTSGATEPSFYKTDFFTYGVVDGILKDNAISHSGSFHWFTKPCVVYSDIHDPSDPTNPSPVIPGAAGSTFTDRVIYADFYGSAKPRPGRISQNGGSGWTNSCSWGHDYIPAGEDGVLEFTPGGEYCILMMGWDETSDLLATRDVGNGFSYMNNSIYLNGVRTFDIYEAGSSRSFSGTYTTGDVFKLVRTGTTVTYLQNDVLIYTSLVSSTGNIWPGYSSSQYQSSAIANIKLTTTRKANILYLGHSQTLTGCFHEDFLLMDLYPESYDIRIDGVPQLVTLVKNPYRVSNLPDPAVGEVVVSRDAGVIKFNPAEAGKAVTATYRCIQKQ